MLDQPPDLPDEFVELIRDALLHLYDLVSLQTHPLLAVVGIGGGSAIERGRRLRQALLDAIEALHPDAESTVSARAWRAYDILESRYIEGREVIDVVEQVSLSKSQYHREHHRALEAVALFLWEQWGLAGRWSLPAASPSSANSEDVDLTTFEVTYLTESNPEERINPKEVLAGVSRLLSPLYARHGIGLRVLITEGLPVIYGSRVALRQALLAVLAHVPSILSSSDVEVTLRNRGTDIVIDVSGQTKTNRDPRNLGVDQSSLFVRTLGGKVSYIPPSAVPGTWQIQISLPTWDRPTMLVVDNHPDFVCLVQRYLADQRWEVIGATDVDQAYEIARRRHPRVILLDVVIPGRDGWDLLLDLRAKPPTEDIPVIVCSVLDEPEVALSLGAQRYLRKPIVKRQLVEALDSLGSESAPHLVPYSGSA